MAVIYGTADPQEAAFFALRGRRPALAYVNKEWNFIVGEWDQEVERLRQEYRLDEVPQISLLRLKREVRILKDEMYRVQREARERSNGAVAIGR